MSAIIHPPQIQTPQPLLDNAATTTAAEAAAKFDLVRVLGFSLWHKWLICFGMVLGLALGVLYTAQAQRIYRATAQLLIVKKQNSIQSGDKKDNLAEYEELVSRDLLSTQMMVISSPVVIEKAIEKHKLESLPSMQLLLQTGKDDLTAMIISRLAMKKGGANKDARDAHIVKLMFDCASEEDCCTILNAIISSYQDFLGQQSRNVGADAIELISKAKDELREQLSEKEAAYHAFLLKTPLIRSTNRQHQEDFNGNIHSERILQFEKARSELQLRYMGSKAHLEQLEADIKDNVPRDVILYSILQGYGVERGMLGNPETELRNSFSKLQVLEAELLERHGPGHPKVRGVRAQLENIQKALVGTSEAKAKAEAGGPKEYDFLEMYLQSVRKDVREMLSRENELKLACEREQTASKTLLSEELEDQTFRNDINRTNALFEAVVSRLQEINFVKDYDSYHTQVIATPRVGIKVAPRVSMILAISLFLGLIGGVGFAFTVEANDKSFRNIADIRSTLRLPIIGQIPFMNVKTQAVKEDSLLDPAVVTFHRPMSRFAEAYRSIRTSLYFSTNGATHRLIQITSAEPGDGKSTVSVNLSSSIAQSGKTVLLIDADCRRPRVHKVLGLSDNLVGLTSVISGEAELGDAIHQTEIDNLWCMPCGVKPSNPSELLSSIEFKELLDCLRDKYDFVIVDTPPMLAVTDPCAVAARVDGVILVVRLKKNARLPALRAADELASVGATVLGLVVNAVAPRDGYRYDYASGYYGYVRSRYYDYGGGNKYYGYGANKYYADEEPEGSPETVPARIEEG